MSGTKNLLVEGMTCSHCVNAVTSAVTALPGVESVSIELVPEGRSVVTVSGSDELLDDALAQAVLGSGYTPVSE
jgi:copper chaperone CopZ